MLFLTRWCPHDSQVLGPLHELTVKPMRQVTRCDHPLHCLLLACRCLPDAVLHLFTAGLSGKTKYMGPNPERSNGRLTALNSDAARTAA